MKGDLFSTDNKRKGYFHHSRGEMLGFIPSGTSKILDVGCGDGQFGQSLKEEFSAEVWGVELDPEAAEGAKGRLDRVIAGDLERGALELPENYFDCIVFNDVLEHFAYPWEVLKKLKKSLTAEGVVVASIPNVRFYRNIKKLLLHKQWQYVDAGILDKTHLRFFTCKSIEDMFTQSGYELLTLEGINRKSFKIGFGFLNMILLNSLADMRYLQFACVAKKKV